MKRLFSSFFVSGLVVAFLFSQGAVAQNLQFSREWRSLEEARENGEYIPPTPPAGGVDGSEVVVPDDYEDLRSALSSGARYIRVMPGVYVGNLRISGERHIYADQPGTVVIFGDNVGNVIELAMYARASLTGIRIVDAQRRGFYNQATIFGEFGGSLTVSLCEIYTTSYGVSVNYLIDTYVGESWFFGSQDATGVKVAHSNPLRAGGTTVRANSFFNIGTGIDASESYTRLLMCDDEPQPCDSNAYYSVARHFIPQRTLSD